MYSTQSVDGRVIDSIDPNTGQLSTLLPNGHRLIRTSIDTQRLLQLLIDCKPLIDREAEGETQRIEGDTRSQTTADALGSGTEGE